MKLKLSSVSDKLLLLFIFGLLIIYLSWRQLSLLELNVKLIEQTCLNSIDTNDSHKFVNRFPLERKQIPREFYDSIKCVKSFENVVNTFLCVYNQSEDIFISRAILNNRLFEPDVMDVFIYYTYRNSDWMVLDIGANIGQFSLFAAKLGNQVVAVEPFIDSIYRLAKAAILESLQSKITLFHNALSNKRGYYSLTLNKFNKGGLSLDFSNETTNASEHSVKTILFNDLVDDLLITNKMNHQRKAIIKIDIEGHELLAFQHSSKLFKCMDIQIILIEWSFLKLVKLNQAENVENLIKMFSSNQMKPFSLNGLELPIDYWNLWPNNIYWKKNGVL